MSELKVNLPVKIQKFTVTAPKYGEDGELKSDGKIIVPLEIELTAMSRSKLGDLSLLTEGQTVDIVITDPQYRLGFKEAAES